MELFFSSGPAVFLFVGQPEETGLEPSPSSPTSGGLAAGGEKEILTEKSTAGPLKKAPLTLEER